MRVRFITVFAQHKVRACAYTRVWCFIAAKYEQLPGKCKYLVNSNSVYAWMLAYNRVCTDNNLFPRFID